VIYDHGEVTFRSPPTVKVRRKNLNGLLPNYIKEMLYLILSDTIGHSLDRAPRGVTEATLESS